MSEPKIILTIEPFYKTEIKVVRELKGIESEVEMFAYLEDLIPNTEG